VLILLVLAAGALYAQGDEFGLHIKPALAANCMACHNPANAKNRFDFLRAQEAADIETKRGLWRSVAAQLRNRTMPPGESKLSEDDRFRIVSWVEERLRQTACSGGDYAGPAMARRLNRREYHATLRDLLGVDLPVSDLFPVDEAGGEGFDTNAETLFIPPMMMERYLEAAQQAVDRAIITPPLNKVFRSAEMAPAAPREKAARVLGPNEEVSASFAIYIEGDYSLRVSIERPRDRERKMFVKVDGGAAAALQYQKDANGGATARIHLARLTRGSHTVTVMTDDSPADFYSLTVEHRQADPTPEKRVLHYRLFGMEPGQAPFEPRKAAERLLGRFLRRAFRRPVQTQEVARYLALYDQAAERGDPYEERIKLALKSALLSPHFLFRIEKELAGPGIHPVSSHELASRLSYFLWSSMPDEELLRLADEGRLQDELVLAAQVERMLDDPRSRGFADSFVGQWLGTKDVGGRVVPMLTELQHYYTPEVSADLRQEPVLLFHHLIGENRSLLELLTANYSFLTERLVRFYELEGKVTAGAEFQKVMWPDARRGGVLGLGSVLAMTSHYKQSSPVLRGAWVLETLFGTPVPSPPPDVPGLETGGKQDAGKTMREKLARHRADPSCSACHNVMDPIGLGLENFDWMGRWRDSESGRPVDATGMLPSGEKFDGPAELREILVKRKEEFLRHMAGKVLGYALGRGLQDGDHCTVHRLVTALEKDGYRARRLVRDVALSVPFRNSQSEGLQTEHSAPAKKRERQKAVR